MSDKTILIPIDFNTKSLIALEQTYNLGKLFGLELVLLYVYEELSVFSKIFSNDQSEDIISNIKQQLDELAEDTRKKSGLDITSMVARGKVHSKILEVAEMVSAKFIVMGTNGQEGEASGKKSIGANTHRIIRHSKCPVITINARHHYNGCRSILLPIDLTLESRQKVSSAIEFSQLFHSDIHVISVLWSQKDKRITNKLKVQIKQVEDFISAKGITCTSELIKVKSDKEHISAIFDYAKKTGDVDLIMIMTQKETGFIEYFIEPDAQEMIRVSDIPIMSITPKDTGVFTVSPL